MKKFGFATVAVSGLAAAILGLAGPAQAADAADAPASLASTIVIAPTGVDHLDWLDDIQPKVNVPQVDTSVRTRAVN
jgi:ABC-type glycerol-3-phosphate transport system substrate-binding protein